MDQLEQDKEIVEFCKKSLSYRKKLSGEEHEVCNQTFFFSNLQMFPISIKKSLIHNKCKSCHVITVRFNVVRKLAILSCMINLQHKRVQFLSLPLYTALKFSYPSPPLPSLFTWPERGMPSFGLWFSCLYS